MKQSNEKITAIYCRVANNSEGDFAIENQKQTLLSYAKEKGRKNIQVFSDNGFCGTDFERPAFQSLLSDIEQGKIDTIIAKSYSRIARNYLLFGHFMEDCYSKGIQVLSLSKCRGTKK